MKTVEIRKAESKRNPEVKYDVYRFANGDVKCTCKGFLFRHKCSHTAVFPEGRQSRLF